MKPLRRLLLVVTVVTSALALVGPVAASAQTPPDSIVVEDGLTQPVFDFEAAIEERVWVEIPTDTNADGELDRVAMDISRPEATESAGLDVPVILEASPYRSNLWFDVPYHTDLDPSELPQSFVTHPSDRRPGPAADLPGSLDNYYVPRGYAVVLAQSVGTADSTGCPTVGDDAETQSAKAVIDWLNGRATAYDAVEGGEEVSADWTTGDVGMIGASYNGTIPNQVATTGVEGLKTIVPIVAISDWYGYYRENGLVVAPGTYQGEDVDVLAGLDAGEERSLGECVEEIAALTEGQDRVTGDYSAFWDARNYLDDADQVEASVFIVDGRNDWNVKPLQWGLWWDALGDAGVERKIWLHNGGHGTPGNNAQVTLPDGETWTYQEMVHRWFDHELWGVDNGITDEPTAIVQREGTGGNETYETWPVPGSRDVTLRLGDADGDQPGDLGLRPDSPLGPLAQSFVDAGRDRRACSVSCLNQDSSSGDAADYLIANPDAADPNRLVYTTDVLDEAVHLSGIPEVSIRASVDNASAANLTAYLVDYGPPGSTEFTMVTRGWMDVQNRLSRSRSVAIRQGVSYRFDFALHPDDYVFQPGRRIGVVILSSDYEFTLRPDPGTQITVDPGLSRVTLPVVGGISAFR